MLDDITLDTSTGTVIFNTSAFVNVNVNNSMFVGVRIHSGTVLDGVPVFCGGFSLEKAQDGCYKYSKEEKSWKEVK